MGKLFVDMTPAQRAAKRAQNAAYYAANKEKTAARTAAYYAANKEKIALQHWAYKIGKRYGLSEAGFRSLLAVQRDCCALCGESFPPGEPWEQEGGLRVVVDHCHDLGVTRGLLHSICNIGLAHVENVQFHHDALAYLAKHDSLWEEAA